ncbi:MAG: general secretion pathway protein GspB [Syntrophales bacterium]
MSVILDALRKLDREKLSRRKGTANIAMEIGRPELTHPGRRISIYIISTAVAAIAAAAITYGVILESGLLSKSSPTNAKPAPGPNQQVAPAPASPQSSVPSKVSPPASVNPPPAAIKHTPAPVPHAPVRNAQEEMSRVPPKVQSPAEKKDSDLRTPVETKSPTTPIVDKKEIQNVVPKELDTSPKKPVEPTVNVSATNPASLKLSAIAWFEDPSRRFAMINGIMATEGSSIDGIKVVEINPTSVRLLHDGQYFEISMSK